MRCFSSFCDIFFYTQKGFLFHLLADFCIVHFSFSSLEGLWYLSLGFFVVFLYYFDNIQLLNFQKFSYFQKNHKKLLEDIKLLEVNFVIIFIIHNILVLPRTTRILKRILRSIMNLFQFLLTTYNDEKSKSSKIKHK